MRKKNKGFTLIELIVTVAIIAIFSGVVLSVIGTGANSYIKTSNTAKSQMEAQDVMDQMENMIIDVNRSVYYAYGKGINDGYGNEIRNDIDSSDSSQSKTFFACSAEEKDAVQKKYAYSCDIIEWDSDEQKLYYGCRVWEGVETETTDNSAADGTENGSTGTDTQSITDNNAMVAGISDDSADNTNENTEDNIIVKSKRTTEVTTKVEKTLIAEDITNFCVDVSKAQTDRIVRFQFTTNKKGKEITTIHTVNLRNQVQIGKPGDGYGTADNTKAWIKIIDYPSEIKPGETLSGFSKSMRGNIDPSTIKWVVDSGKGDFGNTAIGLDDPDIRITASSDSQNGDEIVIYVEAMTTDGKKIQSKLVTINVINNRIPIALITDSDKILLGVGNSYDLTTIGWKIRYSDETMSDILDTSSLKWSMSKNISGITFNAGNITIEKNDNGPGTDPENSVFDVNVSYTDSENTEIVVVGKIEVKLARIDIRPNTEKYKVGDVKPFEKVYKEGGENKSGITDKVSLIYSSEQTKNNFSSDDKFTINDVGKWKVKTTPVNVSDLGGILGGTISAEKPFEVESSAEEKTIKLSRGTVEDTIVANKVYYCDVHDNNKEHFFMDVDWSGCYAFDATWKISGATSTKFENDSESIYASSTNGKNQVRLKVGADEQGFILEVDLKIYTDNLKKTMVHYYHGKLNVKVVTDVKIENTFDNSSEENAVNFAVTTGRTYNLKAVIHVWQYNPSTHKHTQSNLDVDEKSFYWKNGDNSIGNGSKWTVIRSQQNFDLTVGVAGENVTVNVCGIHWDDFKDTRPVVVTKTTVIAQVVSVNNKTTISPGEQIQLYLRLECDNKIIDGSATWQTEINNLIPETSNINYVHQDNVYKEGKEIPITFRAASENKKGSNIKVTVDYMLGKEYAYESGRTSINIAIE